MTMEPCRVVLVDDHSLFRSGLKGLLDRCAGVRVVGEAASGEELLRMLPQSDAEVVFMDFSMPGMDGAATTERALALAPEIRIIALSMFGEGHYYRRMVEAGARGFLMKDCALEEVLHAIETVRGGDTYFCDRVLRSLSGTGSVESGDEGTDDRLSGREIEILVRICRGMSNQEIADELFISKRTVDKHRANILEKTGCKNTASLVVHALRNGLVEVP